MAEDFVKQMAKQEKERRRAAKDAAVQAKLDAFTVPCPFCKFVSSWSMQLKWQEQEALCCPSCTRNIAKAVIFHALLTQRRRLRMFSLIAVIAALVTFAVCLYLAGSTGAAFSAMPLWSVLFFSACAVFCAIDVAVLWVLLKRLLLLRKNLRLFASFAAEGK